MTLKALQDHSSLEVAVVAAVDSVDTADFVDVHDFAAGSFVADDDCYDADYDEMNVLEN